MIVIVWGLDHEEAVATVEAMDEILDRIAGAPVSADCGHLVSIEREGIDCGLVIGLGLPDRSLVEWSDDSDPDAAGFAVEPALDLATGHLRFDFFGTPTDYGPARTQITSQLARQAAREYASSGLKPAGVEWRSAQEAIATDGTSLSKDELGEER
ncbi:Imm1 family immunity protein [Phytomonospora endophytica]|uniref:Immunity protein Imm1 n=1 Tax=Phytomonospora endophytica TaxID=714109 RepID=A0A841FTV0_9ACTN|nr:Imm1 family immunity protein [Phytomonospora endophytica]MBB6038213.1 hypothetical protein [Phytomonospora endophytica]GIG67329.1 hypothetical protein Pen01_36240 [Phytomonospora endophytica]